jgi:hypothetical protein
LPDVDDFDVVDGAALVEVGAALVLGGAAVVALDAADVDDAGSGLQSSDGAKL